MLVERESYGTEQALSHVGLHHSGTQHMSLSATNIQTTFNHIALSAHPLNACSFSPLGIPPHLHQTAQVQTKGCHSTQRRSAASSLKALPDVVAIMLKAGGLGLAGQ